jgi:hypothetical protein
MGRKFYDADVPQLVKVLERIATQLERKNKLDEKKWLLEEKVQKLSLREAKNNSNG